ncbi:uncharacterized protein LOC129913342 isoform X3 [Episyrphus balteatus]|uniref:uncharacterized protein LOC129913342 isoform X3 n=2 Tax=Episyrphus balteatus TaxID=286459 RepID=UPI00248533EE|nr:uncharacterized protein LOC129913342 isoform X3 [Episyrphus balteatus]
MAAAQILPLYYTKNHKSQQGNQSNYFQHQPNKLHQQERSISIPHQQHFQTLPQQNKDTFSKVTENFYCFQSAVNDNKNSENENKNNTLKSQKATWLQLQHHESLFSNTIETSDSKKESTNKTGTQHPLTSLTTANVDRNRKANEHNEQKDSNAREYYCPRKKSCWKNAFGSPKDECPAPKDDTNRVTVAIDSLANCEVTLVGKPKTASICDHNHHYNDILFSAEQPKSADADEGRRENKQNTVLQSNNFLDQNDTNNNKNFQYKTCLYYPLRSTMPSSPSKFSNNDVENNSNNKPSAKYTPILPEKNNVFNTGIYKQSKEDTSRAKVYVRCQSEANISSSEIGKCEKGTTCFANFIAIDKLPGEKKYASTTTTTTTTTTKTATTTSSKTKNCATCCQNNVSSNANNDVAKDLDKTCFLHKRIGSFMKDIPNLAGEGCLLCKFKPKTCQKSDESPECCERCCYQKKATSLPKHEEKPNWSDGDDDERIQSSNFTSPNAFSSTVFLQSHSTNKTQTLSRLSSKKQKCCCNKQQHDKLPIDDSALQQHQQQLRKQRTSKTYNFNCPKCYTREWTNCHTNNKTNERLVNTRTSNINETSFFNKTKTASLSTDENRKYCRKFCGSAIKAFADIKRLTRAILPLIIIFNILPHLYAAEYSFDTTELKDGPSQTHSALKPVMAYLETLPRPTKSPKCDQTFVSRVGGPQNGTFSAPLVHNPRNHSRQCLYIFLAGPGQRVEVVFTTFNLRGSPPDGSAVGELPTCVHEYMDIYSEVQSSDPADLINSPFGGRFCGTIPPRRRISMHRAIAISFFTNKNVSEPDLFEGHYRFLNASEYEIGIPIAGSPCSYTITPSMSLNKTGALISPTYPGAYPKDMSCTYQFLGETNQRVRLEFRDFDLFFGGPHCPFDYIKVYDGPDNSSALIGTYCGQQRNLVLYSSESSLFVHFYTLPRTANTQNRGFKGIYEFSESFVKLDFIRENDGIHIRGSECDQKILSKKESTGFVLSPNYPYPYIPKTVCRYFIYGMQDAQHLERVRLEFSSFNIPKVENKDKGETNCSDGYLKIYLKGQETADAYDKFDYELCGNETQKVVSDGPRLAMVFSSGELQGRGFKGKYTFETEYKIPGTAAPDGTCSFTYVSSSKKRGDLNSPRYPSNYPSETNCSYLFLAEPNEQVTIVFDHFKVKADNVNSTAGAYGASACFEDWLEIYVIYRDNNDRFLGRYCGLTAPGPVESPRGAVGLRITLHTDQENVASGFKARYFFETSKSEVGDCGGNFSNEDSGIITSPHYPSNYKSPAKGLASMACNWYMTARPGYKLSINFEHFSVEGDPMARGCPAAVLRMWTNVDSEAAPIELCGEKPPTEHWHYISTGQSARISFTTTDKTIGAQGFRIVWTEIQDSGPGPPAIGLLCESAYHFQCNIGYCISDKLRCDGIKNCGPGDDSDEMHCESYHGSSQRGSRRSNYNQHGRRLVPNLSPMHTLSSPKKTPTPTTRTTSKYRTL